MNDPCADTPFVWTAGRGGFKRLVAHILIRLLILMPLPPQFQLAAAFFPVSLLWPFVASAEPARNGEKELPEGLAPDNVAPLSERPGGTCGGASPAAQVTRSDILITGTTAIVATNTGTAYLLSLVDPVHPTIIGTIQGVGSKIVLTDANILLSTARSYMTGNEELRGLHAAGLGDVTLIQSTEAFPVSRQAKSLAPTELKLRVFPSDRPVVTAKLEILKNGSVDRSMDVGPFVASTTYPIGTGASFNANDLYEARLVVNDDDPVTRSVSSLRRLRPARFEILTTPEASVVDGEDDWEIVKLFSSAPEVAIASSHFAPPGSWGESATVVLQGTVASAVAPIERVVINEEVFAVSQTDSGSEGRGPFTGTYTASAAVGPQAELVTVFAVDALNHVSTASIGVYPRERLEILGTIPGRDIVPYGSLVPGPADSSPYAFRLTLMDRGSSSAATDVEVQAGGETKVLRLRRQGEFYHSEPLLALAENLRLPGSASQKVRDSRLKVALASGLRMKMGRVEARALATGIYLKASGSNGPADFVDPASGQPYVVEVGAPGTRGGSLSATVTSLTAQMGSVEPGLHPSTRSVTLTRSGQRGNPGYNIYRLDEGLMPVMDGASPGAGLPQRVLPMGRLKLEQDDASLVLPVGPGADQVEWLTEEVSPRYEDGVLDTLLAILMQPVLPKIWKVRQSARFLRGNTPLPGLRVSGFLDRRTSEVDERTGIVALNREGPGEYTPTTFPRVTDAEGRIYFEVRASAAGQGSQKPYAGVVLALNDVVGIRAMGLLGSGGTPPTLPPATDVFPGHGEQLRRTPIVSAYATVGGVPRRHNEWYRAVAKLIVDQVVGDDPELAASRETVKARMRQSLQDGGVPFTEEQINEYSTYFFLGAMLGFPRGAIGAAKDNLVGVFELVGSAGPVLKFMAPTSGPEASLKRMLLRESVEALPSGVIIWKGVLAAEYVHEHREKLRKLIPILNEAAAFLGREEIQVALTGVALKQFMASYEGEMVAALDLLGVSEGTVKHRGLVFGYAVGGMGGYVTEFVTELVSLGLVGEGVGAALPIMLKAARRGVVPGARLAGALKSVSRWALAGEDASKFAKGIRFLMRFLDALGPGVLERWMLKIAEVPEGPDRTMQLFFKLGERDLAEAQEVLARVAKGLSGDGPSGVAQTENVAEAVTVLQRLMMDAEYRSGRPLVHIRLESAEDASRALGNLVDLMKAEPGLAGGAENMLRTVDDIEKFLEVLGRRGRSDAERLKGSLRGGARLAECP